MLKVQRLRGTLLSALSNERDQNKKKSEEAIDEARKGRERLKEVVRHDQGTRPGLVLVLLCSQAQAPGT
ncbi:hypothetical protein Ddc_02323 [Ditylenchus destructor]|nr:hypothetical protein Ddc_02323 [Ditylenchus destructor]